jgi:hypothetical protein
MKKQLVRSNQKDGDKNTRRKEDALAFAELLYEIYKEKMNDKNESAPEQPNTKNAKNK